MLSLIHSIAGTGVFRIRDITQQLIITDKQINAVAAYKWVMWVRRRGWIQRVSFGRYTITPAGHEILHRIEPFRLKTLLNG